jgi:hypothetical protein
MPSVIKLAIIRQQEILQQALRQFLRNQAQAQIPRTLYAITAWIAIKTYLKQEG